MDLFKNVAFPTWIGQADFKDTKNRAFGKLPYTVRIFRKLLFTVCMYTGKMDLPVLCLLFLTSSYVCLHDSKAK